MKGAAFAVSWSRVWLDMAWDNSYVFLGKWPGNAWNYCNGFRFNGKIFIICGFTRRTDPRSECLGFLQQHSIPKRRLRGTTRRESFQHLAISLAASRVVFLGAWVKAWEIFLGMCACVCVLIMLVAKWWLKSHDLWYSTCKIGGAAPMYPLVN